MVSVPRIRMASVPRPTDRSLFIIGPAPPRYTSGAGKDTTKKEEDRGRFSQSWIGPWLAINLPDGLCRTNRDGFGTHLANRLTFI
eukprot:171562-Prorocentrum_minimum.AAC.4